MSSSDRHARIPHEKLLTHATRWATTAGEMLRQAPHRSRSATYKGQINLVTEMDRAVERYIAQEIQDTFPGHDLLAEEDQANVASGSDYRWIVDPLDGTTNYAHGLPIYCVSIACEYRGEVVAGVVFEPELNELFTAVRDGGARLNGEPIRVSDVDRLDRSLLVTGFPYDVHDSKQDNLDNFRKFVKSAQAVRRLGAAALDLCYVSCGRFDGFWELKLAPWDLAAGALVCREAGARVTAATGGELDIFEGTVIASNGRIHDAMLDVLASVKKPG